MAKTQRVLDLLDRLRKPEKSKQNLLRELFSSQLDYDLVNRPLPRTDWTQQAKSALADDPILFATGGEQFNIIYSAELGHTAQDRRASSRDAIA